MLLQRTLVQFPIPTWWLIAIHISSSNGSDILFWSLWEPGTYGVHRYINRQNTHCTYAKNSKQSFKKMHQNLHGNYLGNDVLSITVCHRQPKERTNKLNIKICASKNSFSRVTLAHTFNPSTQEAGAGRSL